MKKEKTIEGMKKIGMRGKQRTESFKMMRLMKK